MSYDKTGLKKQDPEYAAMAPVLVLLLAYLWWKFA